MTSQVIRKTLWIKDMMVKILKNREFGKQIEEFSKVKQTKKRERIKQFKSGQRGGTSNRGSREGRGNGGKMIFLFLFFNF